MPTFTFDNLPALWVALTLTAAAAAIALLRRPALPRASFAAIGVGLLLLALAAGGMTWRRPLPEPVAVMVDLSPSTRTAAYRERAAMEKRIAELLGDVPYRLTFFANGPAATDAAAARLPDAPAERTVFDPPAAPAVVLFSDGRFAPPPAAPPTYVVIDPNLDDAADAAATGLDLRASELAVTTANSGPPRALRINGAAAGDANATAPSGTVVTTRPLASPPTGTITARLAPGDAWPENDVLALFAPPPVTAQRWWISEDVAAPDAMWRTIAPADLPTDPAGYLAPSLVVLNNVAATLLSGVQQQRLQQYVRDLGGGLLILGGSRAFAAGDYPASLLEQLSPLASTPPEPTNRWVLLVDSSGSMNTPAPGGMTRWRYAVDAVRRVLPALPPDDVASVGGFAKDVTWWVRETTARAAAAAPLPPPGAVARDATNLRPAIEAVAASVDRALPTHLLLLTDAKADLGNVEELATLLKDRKVRVHLLLIGDGRGPEADAAWKLTDLTRGSALSEADPQRWTEAARQIVQAARPERLGRGPIDVQFVNDLELLRPGRAPPPWNQVWLKPGAVAVAEGLYPSGARTLLGGRRGDDDRVAAVAFTPNAIELAALAKLVERPPRDPRFRVTWEMHPKLRVTVDAIDGDRYLNGEPLTFEAVNERGELELAALWMQQTAPGRYTFETDPPAQPLLAVVRSLNGGVIDRAALAGRYPPEFDAVGTDRRALRDLAARTGGAIIDPADRRPLNLPRPGRDVPLTSLFATLAATLIAAAMIHWRLT